MRGVSRTTSLADLRPFPTITEGIPILHEDDEEGDMGEVNVHSTTEDVARYGVTARVADRVELQVCANLNLYYLERDPTAYVSPDLMVLEPDEVNQDITSYRIGADGPAPLLVGEVLSERTAQQGDLREKLRVYALTGIREYVLMDVTGRFLKERLLLKRLHRNRTWKDEQDSDGGVTSKLGFRLIIDTDGRLRVVNATTGERYVRPDELAAVQERIRALEDELARLRGAKPQAKKGKGRRRQS